MARQFDLIVVGAGSGNSLIGPELDDWSVALIDDGREFGGTCLNAGCIPTKMFVRVADVAADALDAARLGLEVSGLKARWAEIRDRVFARTDAISESGLDYRQHRCDNVTVYRQSVSFTGLHELRTASGELLRAPRIVIAAGSRPRALDVPVAAGAAVYDSSGIMHLDTLPSSLTILGGGAVAAEFAHVFAAYGVEVTVVLRGERMLSHFDEEISSTFTRLAGERVRLVTRAQLERITAAAGSTVVHLADGREISSEAVLTAIGRVPNSDLLHAAEAGIDLRPDGRIAVDDHQRVLAGGSPAEGLWALGDVSSPWQLKHVANHEARVVAANLLDPGQGAHGAPGPAPHAVFGHPQVAVVGLTEAQAREAGHDIVVARLDYGGTAYGWALEDTDGFCKLVVERGTGALLGAHLIGSEASMLLQPLIPLVGRRGDVRGVARSQYWPHPAAVEVVENALLKAEELL